jgi:hypothetical protein
MGKTLKTGSNRKTYHQTTMMNYYQKLESMVPQTKALNYQKLVKRKRQK